MDRHYWILKTEPSAYSFDQFVKDGTTVWDGVKNPLALKHISQMRPGDEVLIYHTGDEKQVLGLADVVSPPYPDPKKKDPKLLVVQIRAGRRLRRAVTLAEVKADPAFKDLALVRMPRLSVIPVSVAQWQRLLQLGG